jgi:hypothetical protein
MMNESQRRAAEFYARLASIPNLARLSKTARLRLARQFHAASVMRISRGFGGVAGGDFHYNLEFSALHQFARSTLGSLLDGQSVAVQPLDLPPPVWRLQGRALTQTWPIQQPGQKPATELAGLLFQRPFPFGRCADCGSFFVRVRRQRYCSAKCRTHGIESARKATKREYMRKYMAARRAKERKARLRQS